MSTVAAIRELLAKGFTVEQALTAAEAFEPHKQRSSGAIRQAKYRERQALLVTSRDARDEQPSQTVTGDAPPHARVEDNKQPLEITGKKKITPPTVRDVLLECLSPEMAGAVIDHRRAKRSPLTPKAAQLLVKGFLATGQPIAAAEMMIARGWQGFKPEWFEKDKSDGRNGKQSVQDAARDLAERASQGLVDFGPVPPVYLPSRHRDTPGRDSARLLSEGGRGEPRDLRGGGGVGLVLLPGTDRLSGDGPEDWHSGPEPMASNGR